jgi:UDP-N-acetyl-D-mannosaminuronic acid dehydrogenase
MLGSRAVTVSSAPVSGFDVAVVGGCGHVGLPLGLSLADCGLSVALYDIDEHVVDVVRGGTMPFRESGAADVLKRVLEARLLEVTSDPTVIARARTVIVVVGTPIDEYLNPAAHVVPDAIREISDHLRDGQSLVLRSTVYPGVTAMVEALVEELRLDIDVAFCPERIAEGQAMRELRELPQIVSARTQRAVERAGELFHVLTPQTVALTPEEAELAKLFTNTWRYIKFAAANQFFMIASEFGLEFERIRDALAHEYPRAADMPSAGFTAGPCLLKDTMQLAAFNNNNFALGHVSMMINEGLPLFVVSQIEKRFDLSEMTVGLLGMAFKGDSDDVRASLSYKLKRILKLKARAVRCTDPHVTVDPELSSLEDVLGEADLLVIGAPHREYAKLSVRTPMVDIWGISGNGTGL